MTSEPTGRLVEPTARLEASFRRMHADWGDEPRVPWVLDLPSDDFPAYVERLLRASRGEGLKPGYVADSTFWLVTETDEIVAISNLRHALTPALREHGGHIGFGVPPSFRRRGYASEVLRQTLERARAIGVDRALLTCAEGNIASAKTIRGGGGVFDDASHSEHAGCVVERYWIERP